MAGSNDNILGFCNHFQHEDDPEIDKDTFTWKGCWGCHHFDWKDPKPLIDVEEASKIFDVSRSTVRRWIREGNLRGRLFVQGRKTFSLPAPKKYFIERKDFEKFVEEELGEDVSISFEEDF